MWSIHKLGCINFIIIIGENSQATIRMKHTTQTELETLADAIKSQMKCVALIFGTRNIHKTQNKNSHIKGSWMKLCCHQLQNGSDEHKNESVIKLNK